MKVVVSRFASTLFSRFCRADNFISIEASSVGIRDAMLRALLDAEVQAESGFEGVWISVVRAQDIESLWYLRSNVLSLLAKGVGENAAWRKLDDITEMFRGFVSESQFPVQRRIRPE